MQLWFDAWNADIETARRAYDTDMAEQRATYARPKTPDDLPLTCRSGRHKLLEVGVIRDKRGPNRWACRECRNIRKRERRVAPMLPKGPRRKLTGEQEQEVWEMFYIRKENCVTIAYTFGVSHMTVYRTIKRLKQEHPPGGQAA